MDVRLLLQNNLQRRTPGVGHHIKFRISAAMTRAQVFYLRSLLFCVVVIIPAVLPAFLQIGAAGDTLLGSVNAVRSLPVGDKIIFFDFNGTLMHDHMDTQIVNAYCSWMEEKRPEKYKAGVRTWTPLIP
jgi:hypothetical protein